MDLRMMSGYVGNCHILPDDRKGLLWQESIGRYQVVYSCLEQGMAVRTQINPGVNTAIEEMVNVAWILV